METSVHLWPITIKPRVMMLKTIKYKRHKNNRYIGNFMNMSVIVCKRGGEVSLQLCRYSCSCVVCLVWRY